MLDDPERASAAELGFALMRWALRKASRSFPVELVDNLKFYELSLNRNCGFRFAPIEQHPANLFFRRVRDRP